MKKIKIDKHPKVIIHDDPKLCAGKNDCCYFLENSVIEEGVISITKCFLFLAIIQDFDDDDNPKKLQECRKSWIKANKLRKPATLTSLKSLKRFV